MAKRAETEKNKNRLPKREAMLYSGILRFLERVDEMLSEENTAVMSANEQNVRVTGGN